MHRFLAAVLLLFVAPLAAQDKPQVDLAVGYPSTTLVYASGQVDQLGDLSDLEAALRGLSSDARLPDLGTLLAENLDLELTRQELRELASGTRRASGGILDITIKGPKLQFIVEHKNLAPLHGALAKAAKTGSKAVERLEDYDGCPIYRLEVAADTGTGSGLLDEINPFRGWLASLDIHAAILDARFLVLAGSMSGCKDAIDGLLYPEDPADTLLGNRRYQEALKDFDKPAALLFVNIQALINTTERLSGDRGSSPILDLLLREIMPAGTDAAFWAGITQYEQLKSFAAALWLNRGPAVQARVEARLNFHNAPGWLDALRVPARPMPLLDLMPEDTVFAMTTCVDDFNRLYDQCKAFFVGRANEAGKTEIVEEWNRWEKQLADEGHNHREFLRHLADGQALVVLPVQEDTEGPRHDRPGTLVMLGLRDCKAAQEYFFEKVLPGMLGTGAREMEGELSPVEVIGGIEIHAATHNRAAFAFVPARQGLQGVFVFGDAPAVRRMAQMRQKGRSLAASASFARARADMWQAQNVGLYLNLGALLQLIAEAYNSMSRWDWDGWDDEPQVVDRDDTTKDRNPVPQLARFFSSAVLVGGTRSAETLVEMRLSAAGIPETARFKELGNHYRDVTRNFEVRDDLLRIRAAAVAHLALKGAPANDTTALLDNGYLARPEWAIDPYGATDDAESSLRYTLAAVPRDVDIRQAVLLAYQPRPGLRNLHLCVLWNNHIVALPPAQLKDAIERAARGERVDDAAYATPLRPLFETKPASDDQDGPAVEDTSVEVVIIDDDGNERTVRVPADQPTKEVEAILDTPDGAGKPEDEDDEENDK